MPLWRIIYYIVQVKNKRSDNSKIWKCIFISTSTQLSFIFTSKWIKINIRNRLWLRMPFLNWRLYARQLQKLLTHFFMAWRPNKCFQHCNHVVFYAVDWQRFDYQSLARPMWLNACSEITHRIGCQLIGKLSMFRFGIRVYLHACKINLRIFIKHKPNRHNDKASDAANWNMHLHLCLLVATPTHSILFACKCVFVCVCVACRFIFRLIITWESECAMNLQWGCGWVQYRRFISELHKHSAEQCIPVRMNQDFGALNKVWTMKIIVSRIFSPIFRQNWIEMQRSVANGNS